MKTFAKTLKNILFYSLPVCTILSSCGGGGGDGDSFIGAANVSIRTSPGTIDTGDRTLVTIDVNEVHENGILLKVRFPDGLSYVPATSFIYVDGNEVDIDPDKNVADNNKRFLVYFLDESDFSDDGSGQIQLQLVGNTSVSDGEIEVDADVNDTLVADSDEFEVAEPEFGAEDSASITVTN